MTLTNAAETALLALMFNGTTWLTIAQNHATPLGSFYVSLHTGDPGETGNQGSSETSYTNYARIAIARTTAGWTVAGNNASNAALASFAQCGATGATLTHFGIGTDAAGVGNLLGSAALTSSLAVSNGVTPQFAIGALDVNAE